jgi:hypothetical protein
MGKHKLAFVAFDSAKEKHAVAIADDGRDGEVPYLGRISAGRKLLHISVSTDTSCIVYAVAASRLALPLLLLPQGNSDRLGLRPRP